MSVNKVVQGGPGGSIALLQDESILIVSHAADIELRIPATLQGPKRSETAKGKLWITDQRVVFVADVAGSSGGYDAPPQLSSLAIPYTVLLKSSFNLPIFAANYLHIAFLPDPTDTSSGLPSPGRGSQLELKVTFADGTGHSVWKHIEGQKARAEKEREEAEILRESPLYSLFGFTRLISAAYSAN